MSERTDYALELSGKRISPRENPLKRQSQAKPKPNPYQIKIESISL